MLASRPQLKPDNRPLDDLKKFSTTIVTDINDLPTTSPHGVDFERNAQILGLAPNPNAIRGTAKAHRDQELSFREPATPDVVVAWQKRFERMTLLQKFCASEFENVREEFLSCLTRPTIFRQLRLCLASPLKRAESYVGKFMRRSRSRKRGSRRKLSNCGSVFSHTMYTACSW